MAGPWILNSRATERGCCGPPEQGEVYAQVVGSMSRALLGLGIRAVFRKLCSEPTVYRRESVQIGRIENELSTVPKRLIGDFDARGIGLHVDESGHV